MATHQKHLEKECFYFVTFTCYKWLPLIEKSDIYSYIPNWFSNLNRLGCQVCGYVIMPNHIHLLVYVSVDCEGLNFVLSGAKRFLAYEIVKGLQYNNEDELLHQLQAGVKRNEKAKNKLHQVFRLSFDAKLLDSLESINCVLDYIHHNPITGKWSLVSEYTEYQYSSAAFYEDGREDPFGCLDFRVYFD
tara:strand:+ start:200 stop:766 length:567 start_codon:yes stop_codon:yes gene_type:complete